MPDLQELDTATRDMLDKDWESWRPELRFRARCREAYCRYVDKLRARGADLMTAYERAARTVHRRNVGEWTVEVNRLAGEAAARRGRRRKPVAILRGDPLLKVERPSTMSVRTWHRRWLAGGRDVRALVDQFGNRGNRKPRKVSRIHLQSEAAKPLCVYGAMRYIARTVYLQTKRVSVMHAYRRLVKMCGEDGIETVSQSTFYRFIARHFSDFEEYRARYGAKAAFYRYHLFKRRPAPERPLEEVEVDHTLLDVFLRDAEGRVGRPWLTLLICRATRCIVGMHIGFDVPNYGTLQRAVIHAICPKNLGNIPGILHLWPCHGVPEAIITDRGREFLSESFMAAGRDVGFAIVNLPGRCPYLKGAVERFFGTLNVRVLAHLEGATKSRTEGEQHPQAKARLSLADLSRDIVRWIVDEYHQERHEAIGTTPAERWDELVRLHGVRPIKSFQHLMIIMGERTQRKIQSTGIHVENRGYRSDELEELRKRRGGRTKDWEVRIDPYDLGEIWVFEGRFWLRVPAEHEQTSRGITKYQARVHMRIARQLAAAGEEVTQDHLEEAVRLARKQAARRGGAQVMRYYATGALPTPVVGNTGLPTILGGDPVAAANNDMEADRAAPPTPSNDEMAVPTPKRNRQPSAQMTEVQAPNYARLLRERLGRAIGGRA